MTTAAATTRVAQPHSELRDWFIVPAWTEVWDRLGLAPHALPGVRLRPDGSSLRKPFPREVHRNLLPVIGYGPSSSAGRRLPAFYAKAPSGVTLRPHQVQGIDFIQDRRGTLLSDEPRVGKTPQVIFSHDPDDGKHFVVGPIASRLVWHEWAARRYGPCVEALAGKVCSTCERVFNESTVVGFLRHSCGKPSFAALAGRATREEALATDAHVLFANFAIVYAWSALFANIDIGTLTVDEAHMAGIGNASNQSVEGLRRFNTVAHRTVFCTGTPYWNKVIQLHAVLDMLNPAAWGTRRDFGMRYCGGQPGPYGFKYDDATNQDELKLRMGQVMLRRTWNDVAKDLPPITRSLELVPLTVTQLDEVVAAEAEIRRFAGGKQNVIGRLARLRRLFAEAKLSASVEEIARTVASGHPVVAWTYHRDIADRLGAALAARGIVVDGVITGGVSAKMRERILHEAAGRQGPHVLVAEMLALGTAVSLAWTSHQVFVELDWSPPNISQPEMRPFDGKHPLSTVFMVADCDVDRKLSESLLLKLQQTKDLGLAPGAGTVAEVLGSSFGIDHNQTLDELAALILSEVV